MRKWVFVMVCTLMAVSDGVSGAPKPRGQLATIQFNGDLAIAADALPGILDGSFRADLAGAGRQVCFGTNFAPTGDDDALQPVRVSVDDDGRSCFWASGVHIHGVATLPMSPGFGARQMGLSFLDDRGYLYSLQFGDVYANPPDYVRGTCLASTNNSCTSASLDSEPGEHAGQSSEARTTGDEARLSVQIGRKKPVVLGIYVVPFQATVTVQ